MKIPRIQSLFDLPCGRCQENSAKVKKINKPYARKIQILTVMEQERK